MEEKQKLHGISHGITYWASSPSQQRRYVQQLFDSQYLPDPDRGGGRGQAGGPECDALALYGSTLLWGRAPPPAAITDQPTCPVGKPMCSSLSSLSADIIQLILCYVEERDLSVLCLVNSEWEAEASFLLKQLLEVRLQEERPRPTASRPFFDSMLGQRVVVAFYYDRPRRWLAFSGLLEKHATDGFFDVCMDSVAGHLGIYDLRYRLQRELMSMGFNTINPEDPPPMLFLPPSYPNICLKLVASDLIKYYTADADCEDAKEGTKERKREALFKRPASFAEDRLALPLSAITPACERDESLEESLEVELASDTSEASLWDDDLATEDEDSDSDDSELDEFFDAANLEAELEDLTEQTVDEEAEGEAHDEDVVYSSDEDDVGGGRTAGASLKDAMKADIRAFLRKHPTVQDLFKHETVHRGLLGVKDLCSLLGATQLEDAEDIAVPLDTRIVGRHFYQLLHNVDGYRDKLAKIHSELGVDVELEPDVISHLKFELGEEPSLATCVTIAQHMATHLTFVRTKQDELRTARIFTSRQGVENLENGSHASLRANQASHQFMSSDGHLLLKPDSNVAELNAEQLLNIARNEQSAAAGTSPERRAWAEGVVADLRKLETVDASQARSTRLHGDSRLICDDAHASVHGMPFCLGAQGKDAVAEYEEEQGRALRLGSLLFKSLFGKSQSDFPSMLMPSPHFWDTEWTTGTAITKTKAKEATASARRHRQEQESMLARFEARVAKVGLEKLGFAAGEEGKLQAELWKASKLRFMNPHADTMDYADGVNFWDGLAMIVFHARLAEPVEPIDVEDTVRPIDPTVGALQLLGKAKGPNAAAPRRRKNEDGASALDFMKAVRGEGDRDIVNVPACLDDPEHATILIARPKTMMHGADGRADERDVSIWYKTVRQPHLTTPRRLPAALCTGASPSSTTHTFASRWPSAPHLAPEPHLTRLCSSNPHRRR